MIVEYCRFGNLQNYLIHHRDSFINQVDLDGRFNPSLGAESLARAAAMYRSRCRRRRNEWPS